jgi:hypothetical protein
MRLFSGSKLSGGLKYHQPPWSTVIGEPATAILFDRDHLAAAIEAEGDFLLAATGHRTSTYSKLISGADSISLITSIGTPRFSTFSKKLSAMISPSRFSTSACLPG